MKKLLVLSLLVGSLYAQPKPVLAFGNNASGWQWWGSKTVYPGYDAWFGFSAPGYSIPVTCAATGNRCDVSGSGYTLTGTEANIYIQATTVPTGMETMKEGGQAKYDACNISGTTLQLCQHGTSTIETFSSTGSGVKFIFMPAALANNHSFYVATSRASDMGFPTGSTVTWGETDGINGQDFSPGFTSANGYPYSFGSAITQAVKVHIPTNATPGNYTITITDCDAEPLVGAFACPAGSNSDTVTFTVTVTALTYLSDALQPSSFPAITGLSTWVGYMTNGAGGLGGDGDNWCNRATGALTPADISTVFGSDNSIFYYDGGGNFHLASKWIGDAGLEKCAQNLLQQSGFTNANSVANTFDGNYLGDFWNHGSPPGYRIFPMGFAGSISQDARYIGVLEGIGAVSIPSKGTTTVRTGCYISDAGIRESAYAFISMLAVDKAGLAPLGSATWQSREQGCADMLIGHLNSHLDGVGRYNFIEYFLDGLAEDALIKWWGRTKDPRVPMVIKASLDAYFANYNLTTHIAMWNPDPPGLYCATAPVWYSPVIDDHCQDSTTSSNTQLQNLNSFAFAWYWRVSGDDTYRTEGDEIFAHAFDGQNDFSGKTWSQLYRYSFNYVGWRQGWLSPERSVQ